MRVTPVDDGLSLLFDDPDRSGVPHPGASTNARLGHSEDARPGAREPGRDVPRVTLVVALVLTLAVAVCVVMAAPAGAVRRSAMRHKRAHVPSSCAGADLWPTDTNIARVRAATLCLVNRERAGQGEGRLRLNERLERAAQTQTNGMALGDYFAHVGPEGDTPVTRMRAAGYVNGLRAGHEVGENIGWGALALATPRAIVTAWMASPLHRANILNARFRETAIAVSVHPPASLVSGQSGAIYTQDFGG